jgi:hypothetical protein
VTECEDVCKDAFTNLTIYFFDEKTKQAFEKIKLESGFELPDRISCAHVESFEQMLFWKDRGSKKQSSQEEEQQSEEQQPKDACMLCSRPIKVDEECVTCHECLRQVHGICNDVHAEGDGLCPCCDALLDCDISVQRVEHLSDDDDSVSEIMQIAENLDNLNFDQESLDSFDELLAPLTSKAERQSLDSLDELLASRLPPKVEMNCLSVSDDSSMEMSPAKLPPKALPFNAEIISLSVSDDSSMEMSPAKLPPKALPLNAEIICLSADDDSSMEITPAKLPRKAPPSDTVIDLCSP